MLLFLRMWYYWVLLWGRGATLGRLTSVYALLASIILAESLHPQLFKDTLKTEIMENILPKTTEQRIKSVAYVTNNKRLLDVLYCWS